MVDCVYSLIFAIDESNLVGIVVAKECSLDGFVKILDCPFEASHDITVTVSRGIWVSPKFNRQSDTIGWIRLGQLFVFDSFTSKTLEETMGIAHLIACENHLTPIMDKGTIAKIVTNDLKQYADLISIRLSRRLASKNNGEFYASLYADIVKEQSNAKREGI